MNRHVLTDTLTGEIIDLNPLARPPRRTRYNRPVRRRTTKWRKVDSQTAVLLSALAVLVAAASLAI